MNKFCKKTLHLTKHQGETVQIINIMRLWSEHLEWTFHLERLTCTKLRAVVHTSLFVNTLAVRWLLSSEIWWLKQLSWPENRTRECRLILLPLVWSIMFMFMFPYILSYMLPSCFSLAKNIILQKWIHVSSTVNLEYTQIVVQEKSLHLYTNRCWSLKTWNPPGAEEAREKTCPISL